MRRSACIWVTAMAVLWASSADARPRHHRKTAARSRTSESPRKDPGRVCKRSYREAQRAERDGQLFEAKALLQQCGDPACGEFLEHQCTIGYARVSADIPSIVPSVTDAAGEPVVAVNVWLDDVLVAEEIDGLAIKLEPGLHVVAFETDADGVFARRKIVARQGERNRRIDVRLHAPARRPHRRAATPPPAVAQREPTGTPAPTRHVRKDLVAAPDEPGTVTRRHSRLPGYLLIGLGVVGASGYGVLTYWGRQDNAALSTCSPNCPRASFEHVRKLYISANVSLGVGGVALVAGSYLLWRAWSPYRVDVQPTRGGGIASIRGEF